MHNSSPLYRQIAAKIKEDIMASDLAKDEAIPAENKLAENYQVSRVTIRQAIQLLVQEDILYRIQGSGTYLKTKKIKQDIDRLKGFTEEMHDLNQNPTNKVIDFQMELPDENVRSILKLGKDEKVYYIRRLRCIDDTPLILEETYMPVKLFPDLSIEVMTLSKYEYVEKKGYIIKERQGEITSLIPDQSLKEILHIPDGTSILAMNVWAYLEGDIIFEYTRLYYRSDQCSFKFTSKRF